MNDPELMNPLAGSKFGCKRLTGADGDFAPVPGAPCVAKNGLGARKPPILVDGRLRDLSTRTGNVW
jgi:hypothetical protein